MKSHHHQLGYFSVIAVIFILVIGLMGALIAYTLSGRGMITAAQIQGLRAFYIAESGLEIGTRLLTSAKFSGTPTRLACAGFTGTAAITNATMGSGTFTLTTTDNSPIFAATALSTVETATDTTLNVVSTAGFAPMGRLVIDGENINYAAISGNTFIGVTRGVNGTLASAHPIGAAVSQYQCNISSKAGIPNLTSPLYQRELEWGVQLQDAWTVAAETSNSFVFSEWNEPTELAWNPVTLAAGANAVNLNDVSMLSNADGWAVGETVSLHFTFLRWNGSAWSLVTLANACSGQHLNGVSAISVNEAWAVGERKRVTGCSSGNWRYSILLWNGSTWSQLAPSAIPADTASNQSLNAVHVIDTTGSGTGTLGFAVGDVGTILRYNGATWVTMTSPTTQNLFGVYVVSASEAWATGAGGVILRWNGSSWSSFTSPTTTQMNAIKMLDTNGDGLANIGYAVGSSQRILSYNGASWTLTDLGGTNLNDVAIFNENDVWAVGASGLRLHWDGSTWTTITASGTAINAISVINPRQRPVAGWQQVFR